MGRVWLWSLTAWACGGSAPPGDNVLIVLLDDVGVEALGSSQLLAEPAHTPVLDGLADQGVRFTQAYAYPVCASSRQALLTGRHGRRTGLGTNIPFERAEHDLPRSEITLPELIARRASDAYWTGVYGKWHLATRSTRGVRAHPRSVGFDHHVTTVENIGIAMENDPPHRHDFFHWEEVRDGEVRHVDGYHTSAVVDDVLQAIEDNGDPFLIYLPLHAAHIPLHVPPTDLQTTAVEGEEDRHTLFRAMIEAADTEIGRLLASLDPATAAQTTVIVVGDNGTDGRVGAPGWETVGAKGSLYDGGVRVPLIISGAGVSAEGTVVHDLAHLVDLYPTVADLVGARIKDDHVLDGVSLMPYLEGRASSPLRATAYAELFGPAGSAAPTTDKRMITDGTHKLVEDAVQGTLELRSVGPSPEDESEDLLLGPLTPMEQQQLERLSDELRSLVERMQ
ncbi:MAG: sulfatase-like hydrolase/transferase [Myxococcales bacterium]|nr:sulfatase-like hydrolase/transferase [Myxococcales bacterium]